ncbi:hypothetical protein [uncultured Tenacibaculum sp.]|uniref:hypothetical protein n=1 Tax=uncultured Tenacibaculum sp. TaxID=174713 RepID=UPI002631A2CF|nr:hypothetical protein [uncultured Tenacibaculum sp.]
MIKIQPENLSNICEVYKEKIKQEVINKINILEDVIKILIGDVEFKEGDLISDIKIKTSAVKVVTGLTKMKNSKQSKGKGKEKADLNYTLFKLKTSLDKRSICRKRKRYKKVETDIRVIKIFINSNDLFGSQPESLINLDKQLKVNLKDTISTTLYNFLFDYSKYYALINKYIGEALDLKSCPYCNRNYITYIPNSNNRKRIIGPSYDHFFSKSRYQYLSLSFYNLIPSCYVCNSNLKGNINFDLKYHLHPYLEGFEEDVFFDFDLSVKEINGKKDICFKPNLKINSTISDEKKKKIFGEKEIKDSGSANVFKLNEVYQSHSDSVEEIHEKFDKNSKYYLGSVSEVINKLNSSEEEFYRFHFRNYFNRVEFNKRPLAKLDRDIYDKMKRISIELKDTIKEINQGSQS